MGLKQVLVSLYRKMIKIPQINYHVDVLIVAFLLESRLQARAAQFLKKLTL